MYSVRDQPITQRTVLRVLISGFALVLLLLGVAGFVALRGARELESDAKDLVREELVVLRLLNEVQAEEATMTAVLFHLVRDTPSVSEDDLIRELLEADRAVSRAADVAQKTAGAARWRKLNAAVSEFSAAAQSAIRDSDRSTATLSRLFVLHDTVIVNVREVVSGSTDRAGKVDELMAARSRDLASESFGLLGSCFLLGLLCAVLTVRMATDSIRQLEWQAEELNQVSWQMIRGQEEAARRFSHELHDELGQSLAAIRANLTGMRPEDYEARRQDCFQLVDDSIANVRELSQLLRPVLLDDFGLDAALRWLTDKFGQRTGKTVIYKSDFHERLADETETHLFRITQEALTNIARHSGATEVHVSLGKDGEEIRLNIADNGCGLGTPPVRTGPSIGMVGMRARARQVGGELRVSTPRDGGLRVEVSVPSVIVERAD